MILLGQFVVFLHLLVSNSKVVIFLFYFGHCIYFNIILAIQHINFINTFLT